MPLLTTPEAQGGQNLLLTNVVRGYRQAEYVGDFLFPRVTVSRRSGLVITFGKEHFVKRDTRRTPGSNTRRISLTYGNEPYVLYQDRIEGELAYEILDESQRADIPFDLQSETAQIAMSAIEMSLEYDTGQIAQATSNYDTGNFQDISGTDQWTDPASEPQTQIDDWRETVRRKIGVYPNRILLGANAFKAAKKHEFYRTQFHQTSSGDINEMVLARLMGFEGGLRVGKSLWLNPETDALEDIWNPNAVIMAYVPPSGASNLREPSFAYTYTLADRPMAEDPYFLRNTKTWYFPVEAERLPVICSGEAGFLATNVTAS